MLINHLRFLDSKTFNFFACFKTVFDGSSVASQQKPIFSSWHSFSTSLSPPIWKWKCRRVASGFLSGSFHKHTITCNGTMASFALLWAYKKAQLSWTYTKRVPFFLLLITIMCYLDLLPFGPVPSSKWPHWKPWQRVPLIRTESLCVLFWYLYLQNLEWSNTNPL